MRGCMWMVLLLRIKSLYFMRDPIRELAVWTHDELDYRREARIAICWRIMRGFCHGADSENLLAPHYGRVLTMEFLEGPNVSTYLKYLERGDEDALARLREAGFDPAVFSSNVITNSCAMRSGMALSMPIFTLPIC